MSQVCISYYLLDISSLICHLPPLTKTLSTAKFNHLLQKGSFFKLSYFNHLHTLKLCVKNPGFIFDLFLSLTSRSKCLFSHSIFILYPTCHSRFLPPRPWAIILPQISLCSNPSPHSRHTNLYEIIFIVSPQHRLPHLLAYLPQFQFLNLAIISLTV